MYRGPGFSKMFLLSSLLTPIKQTPNLNLKEEYKSLRITFEENYLFVVLNAYIYKKINQIKCIRTP